MMPDKSNKLHLEVRAQRLPGGTVDRSGEFFVHDNEIYCRTKGQTFDFYDFPEDVVDMVRRDMDEYPEKMGYLVEWGLTDIENQMRQYLFCLYGGHDDKPDFSHEGEMMQSEYVDCGRRCGACKFEGKLCNSLVLEHGTLSSQQVKTLELIGKYKQDDEIADELCVSHHTVRYYKDEIMRKAGLDKERKTALVGLAIKLGLALP